MRFFFTIGFFLVKVLPRDTFQIYFQYDSPTEMEVSYNLRYQKSSFSNKILLDKEGEAVIYTKGFRLKGKGAADTGELINFSEIKEFYYRTDKILFITFNKEKYTLLDAGTLFDQLLIDIYKARNEFLMDALFMKRGKLRAEYECNFQRLSKFGKLISNGNCKVRLNEKSLIVLPETQDAFSLHYDFVNFHEFDEDMEYNLKIVMDDGTTIFLSRFGNDFEFFQEKMNQLLGGMYGSLINDVFKPAFPYFDAASLLKLAYKMKGGKAVSLKDITKIDPEMAKDIDEFIFDNEDFKEKTSVLRSEVDDYGILYGIAKDPAVADGFIKWVMFTIPAKNVVVFSILPRWKQEGEATEPTGDEKYENETFFFRIIMEKGNPSDKVDDKVGEVNNALVVLDFAKDPCYKDKRELRHSPYQYAIRKLPFLRILRKSFVGKVASKDVKDWQKQVAAVLKNAALK